MSEQQPRMRRLLSGKTVSVDEKSKGWGTPPEREPLLDPTPRMGAFYVAERERRRQPNPRHELNDRSSARRARRDHDRPEVIPTPGQWGREAGLSGTFPNRAAWRNFVRLQRKNGIKIGY